MSSKQTIKGRHDPGCCPTATQFVSGTWIGRFAGEIAHRCRLLLFAPTVQRSLATEREREHNEREKMAEEYARGYLEGWHECYAACLEAVEESVSGQRNIWAVGELLAGPGSSLKTN
jgi:hypothetical protein